jgi:hypothetical protein
MVTSFLLLSSSLVFTAVRSVAVHLEIHNGGILVLGVSPLEGRRFERVSMSKRSIEGRAGARRLNAVD